MSLIFNEIVFNVSYGCNAACRHCYTSCSPKAPKQQLDTNIARELLDDAVRRPDIEKNATVAGGEPTLFRRAAFDLIMAASSQGFRTTLITNGYWGRRRDDANRLCTELSRCGLQRIEISTDAFHEPYIPYDAVGNAIEIAKRNNLDVTLRTAVCRGNSVGDLLSHLADWDLSDVLIVPQPASLVGRGQLLDVDTIFFKPSAPAIPDGNCAELLNLTVSPAGDLFPCCAGSELSRLLRLGNIHDKRLPDILDDANRNTLVRQLIQLGPAFLFQQLSEATRRRLATRPFLNICDLCNLLFADPAAAEELQEFSDRHRQAATLRVLQAALDLVLSADEEDDDERAST